jgi:triphosphoribosyl-dephospho-CoA synthase
MKGTAFDEVGFRAQVACIWEATARKVGNVHPTAAFDDTEFVHFPVSAVLLGQTFTRRGPRAGGSVGHLIYQAGGVARFWVKANTNLGIAILLAPLAYAELAELRPSLQRVLAGLSVQDAVSTYAAIRMANPGGMGDVPKQDVKDEPTVTLLEAMKLAADRDLIARQYANGYADVFDLGVPAFVAAFGKFGRVEPAVIECQLKWMAAVPDSLIARKRGRPAAEDVQRRVQHVLALGGLDTPQGRAAGVELDRHLRSDGNKLNPGTTADLVTACLFVALREGRVPVNAPFRWDVPDWL